MKADSIARPINESPSAQRLAQIPLIESLGEDKAELFRARRFFTPQACREVIEYTRANSRPSTIADPNGDENFRTNCSSDMPNDLPVAQHIREMMARLLGLPLENAEQLQAQSYEVGQEFKAHCDWFRPGSDDYDRYCAKSGQRTWTAMAYMNDVPAGGETAFPRLGFEQEPEGGTLLMWNNQTPEGAVNPWTIHHAKPILEGSKYVVTLWFRERPWA